MASIIRFLTHDFKDFDIVNNGAMDIFLGIIAVVTSLAMFLQPVPTFWRVCKKKDVGGLLPYPYSLATVNYFMWHAYALPFPFPQTPTTLQFRNFCLACTCILGSLMSFIYMYIFSNCCDRFLWFQCGMCLVYLSPFLMPRYWLLGLVTERRDTVLEPMVIVLGTMLYATPIFNVINAVRQKQVRYLPIRVLSVSCLNAFAWMIYACLPPKVDLCLLITHGFGTIFTIAQLGVAYEIQNFMTVWGTGKRTTECSVNDDEDSKLNGSAYTPLLDGSDSGKQNDEECCRDDGVKTENSVYTPLLDGSDSGKHNDEECCRDDGVKTIEHSTHDCDSKIHPSIDDVEIENSPTSSSFLSGASFFGGAMERELEAKFNEFGLSAVMSYALASYFGGFRAALYVEKNSDVPQVSDKLNLSNGMLRESSDKSHVKLKRFLECVWKKDSEALLKSKEFLEAVQEKESVVKIKLKEFLEAVGMQGELDFEILQD